MNEIIDIENTLEKYRDPDGYINLNKCKEFISSVDYQPLGTNAFCWIDFDASKINNDDNQIFNMPRVLFKKYEDDLMPFGEVLFSKVARNNNINSAIYDFARFKDSNGKTHIGTISYDLAYTNGVKENYILDGVSLFTRYGDKAIVDALKNEYSSLDLIRILNKKFNRYSQFAKVFDSRYPSEDNKISNELKTQLIKINILGVLFDNADENLWNFLLLTDKQGNKPRLYSIDTSHVFCFYNGLEFIKDTFKEIKNNGDEDDLQDYLLGGSMGYDLGVKEEGYHQFNSFVNFYRTIKNDKKLANQIKDLVKEIDIDKEVDELIKIHKPNKIVTDWIRFVFNYQKDKMLMKFKHIDQNPQLHVKPDFLCKIKIKKKGNNKLKNRSRG